MIHEPNDIQWKVGDIVIHDSDAKRPEMLMRVIGYTKNELCQTQYVESNQINRGDSTVWENDIMYLHDPARFDIKTKKEKK